MMNKKNKIIRAGAGAGKTTWLIRDLIGSITSYHKKHNHFPKVAVSTFTRKATRELKERVIIEAIKINNPKLTQYICYSPLLQISTLHGLFYRFLCSEGFKLGLSPGLSVLSNPDSEELFSSILKDVLLEKQKGLKLLDHYSFKEVHSILWNYVQHAGSFIECAPAKKEDMLSGLLEKKQNIKKCLEVKKSAKLTKELLELEKEEQLLNTFCALGLELSILGEDFISVWKQNKKDLNQVTLNDLETLTWEVIQKEPLHTTWDFWFLDEYQDLNILQKKILDRLCKNSQVFIVGDPQQSIYHFRGAVSQIFDQKEQELKQDPVSKCQELKTNYRSLPELTTFFNDFFKGTKYRPMDPVQNTFDPKKEVVRFLFSYPDFTDRKEDLDVLEQNEVIKRIKELIDKGVKPDEIAILARQNKDLSQLSQHLKTHNIPFHLHSSSAFLERREVIDALFLWQFLLNPHDNENLIGLLRTPFCFIPDQTIVDLLHSKKHISFWSILKGVLTSVESTDKELKQVVVQLQNCLERAKQVGLVLAFQEGLEDLNFMKWAYFQDRTGVREANLWKLIYTLKASEQTGSLFSFADRVLQGGGGGLDEDQAPSFQNAPSALESYGVQMMTIHSAKGLEFKHVILIKTDMGFRSQKSFSYFAGDRIKGDYVVSVRSEKEDKRIKSSFQKNILDQKADEELEEWDRLLYVAMTRAQISLTLIGLGPIGKNSWQERFPFFSTIKVGTHQTPHYSYTLCYPDRGGHPTGS